MLRSGPIIFTKIFWRKNPQIGAPLDGMGRQMKDRAPFDRGTAKRISKKKNEEEIGARLGGPGCQKGTLEGKVPSSKKIAGGKNNKPRSEERIIKDLPQRRKRNPPNGLDLRQRVGTVSRVVAETTGPSPKVVHPTGHLLTLTCRPWPLPGGR